MKTYEHILMLQSRQRIVQLITYNSKPKQIVSFISEPQDIDLIGSFCEGQNAFANVFAWMHGEPSLDHRLPFSLMCCILRSWHLWTEPVMLPCPLTSGWVWPKKTYEVRAELRRMCFISFLAVAMSSTMGLNSNKTHYPTAIAFVLLTDDSCLGPHP